MHLAPVALKDNIIVDNAGTTYTDLLKKLLEGKIGFNHEDFIIKFITEHTQSGGFTYKTHKGKAASNLDALLKQKMVSNPSGLFSITVKELDALQNNQLYVRGNRTDVKQHYREWIPSILIGNALYIVSKEGKFDNFSTDDEMSYMWIGTVDQDGTFHLRKSKEKVENVKVTEPTEPVGSMTVKEEAPIQPVEPVSNLNKRDIKEIAHAVAVKMVAEDSQKDLEATERDIIAMLQSSSNDEISGFIKEAESTFGELRDSQGNKIC